MPVSGSAGPCETSGMDHDAAWKRLFGLPALIEHLLVGFAGPAARRLDFGTLRQLPADSVDAGARRLRGDAAWRVDFNDATGRSLVLLLEFQSRVDRSMAERMLGYTGAARRRLSRQGAADADGEVRVLPAVLYSGDRPWNAPGGTGEVGVTAKGEAWLPLRGAYLLLDANRRAGEDLPRDNLVGAVFGLNAAATPGGMADRLRAVPRGLDGGALRALIDWIRAVFPEKFPQSDAAEVIASLAARFPDISKEEGTMMALAKRAREWEEEYGRQGFEKGLRQGLERGLAAERELLRRQAARKFGAAAGDALVRHLAGVSDPDRLAVVGERIIDCGTGAELIERLGADRDGAGAH